MTTTTTAPAAAALELRGAAIVGVAMMDESEARESISWMRADLEQADVSLGSFRRRALEFRDREGWKALGYAGYLEAIQKELKSELSLPYISRLVRAAEIERDLGLPVGKSDEVPERQLRALAELETVEERQAAWQRADELAGDKPRTAKHVQQAVEEVKPARRCGHCDEPSAGLTVYGAGIVPTHPRGVALCDRCIANLMREQTTATTAPAIPHLPPPAEWKATQKRATALGLRLEMSAAGAFGLYRLNDGQCHNEAHEWTAALTLLDGMEDEQFRILCERAEQCGATIDYTRSGDPGIVFVLPPMPHQQRELSCVLADLRWMVPKWEGTPAPAPPTLDFRAALLRQWRTVESALDRGDTAAALENARAIVRALENEL